MIYSPQPFHQGDRHEFTFGVVADVGQTSDSQATYGYLLSDSTIQSVLHVGDMSYSDCDQVIRALITLIVLIRSGY